MNPIIWLGLIIDLAIAIWVIFSISAIKGYLRRIALSLPVTPDQTIKSSLRRIALSLPVTPEQMKLINGNISAEEAMALFEKAGGTFHILHGRDGKTALSHRLTNTNSVDSEVLQILEKRSSEVTHILHVRGKSNP